MIFMCGAQNSWFSEASLRICCVGLFECKSPGMLKLLQTDMCGREDYTTRLKKYHVQCC